MKKGALVFTILACVGVVGTGACAAYSYTKAVEAMKKKKHEVEVEPELEIIELDETEESHVSKKEIVIDYAKTTWKYWLPTVLVGGSTIASIIAAHKLNQKQIMALGASVAGLAGGYSQLKDKVIKEIGPEKFFEIEDKVKQEIANPKDCIDDYEETQWFYDEIAQLYFESTKEQVMKAEYNANKALAINGYACFGDFLIDAGCKNIPERFHSMGWSIEQLQVDTGDYFWLDFDHITRNDANKPDEINWQLNDGRKYTIIYHGSSWPIDIDEQYEWQDQSLREMMAVRDPLRLDAV